MKRTTTLRATSLAIVASILFMFVIPMAFPTSSATSQVVSYVWFHKNSSSLNGGQVANTTTLWSSSAQTIAQSATQTSQFSTSWDLYPCLTAPITLVPGNVVFTVFLQADASLSGVTLGGQVNEIATCGSGSETTLFGGEQTSTIDLTTTTASFSVSVNVASDTTIPSGDSIHLIVYVNPNTGSTAHTITLSYDVHADDSNVAIALDQPVTVNSFTLAPQQITSPATSLATLNVSDAFGIYDIASAKLNSTILGVQAISLQSMNPSSSNTPTAYTGIWTTLVNPSLTSYNGYSGEWATSAAATDNKGNPYASGTQYLAYQGSSGPAVTTTTQQSSTHGSKQNTNFLYATTMGVTNWEIFVLIAAVVFAAISILVLAYRR